MILDTILAETRRRVQEQKAVHPEGELRAHLVGLPVPLDMAAALRGPGVSIIAEIKRASPSKGVLNSALEPASLAVTYARSGADGISVLTEPKHFHGSLDDLVAVRSALARDGLARPLLRKDFAIDPYQVVEARLWGADAVLLIVAALDDAALAGLHTAILDLGMTPLVEVHTERDVQRALPLSPLLIGINNRNLHDFTVDLGVTRRLRPLIPPGSMVISESGISHAGQMQELAALGVDAVLIGEALVRAADPEALLRDLKAAGQ